MKKNLLFSAFLLAILFTKAQLPAFQWAKQLSGASAASAATGITTMVDNNGNIITAGYFTGLFDFDPGTGTYTLNSTSGTSYISKLDATGNFLWAAQFGGTLSNVYSVALDANNNIYTTGTFQQSGDFDPGAGVTSYTSIGGQDIFISKLDPLGNFLWAKPFGSTSIEEGLSISVDGSGNAYTTGYFGGTIDFDPGAGVNNLTPTGGLDVFISKLDASGNFVWAKNLGGPQLDKANSIALDAAGNIYLTGFYQQTSDFDPGPGTVTLTSSGQNDIFISKLNSSGDYVWAKSIGSSSNDAGNSITVDAAGNVYTTGFFCSTADFDPGSNTFNLTGGSSNTNIFISKLDPSGNFVFAKSMNATSVTSSNAINLDANGNIYTAGSFSGTVDFDPSTTINNITAVGNDVFISKLDASGYFVWTEVFGGPSDDKCLAMTIDPNFNIYTTGSFKSTVDFDPSTNVFNLTSISGGDAFIHKLNNITIIGIKENIYNNSISVYPNPSYQEVAITIESDFYKQYENLRVELYTSTGGIITHQPINSEKVSLNLKDLNSGLFFLKIISNNKIISTHKIIKD